MNIDTSTALYVALTIVGGFWAVGKLLLRQFETRLAERFKAQDDARLAADAVLNETLARHLVEEREMTRKLADLERDFLNWKGELPLNYVRREDYIRGQVVIEAKLDSLYDKLELVQLKGSAHG